MSRITDLFVTCDEAVTRGIPIVRATRQDKEFALQDWIKARLDEAEIPHTQQGRNAYPDFVFNTEAEGLEVKGLAHPGREATYDANSNVPTGESGGRTIYCAFVRYPPAQENQYAVHDFVIFHGDLLNPTRGYVHQNKSLRTFGGYGDIMIRDRKMYVIRTPWDVCEGLGGRRTLILPAGSPAPEGLVAVGEIERVEAEKIAVAYTFDLRDNTLTVIEDDNPTAGKRHTFRAYRGTADGPEVRLRG